MHNSGHVTQGRDIASTIKDTVGCSGSRMKVGHSGSKVKVGHSGSMDSVASNMSKEGIAVFFEHGI